MQQLLRPVDARRSYPWSLLPESGKLASCIIQYSTWTMTACRYRAFPPKGECILIVGQRYSPWCLKEQMQHDGTNLVWCHWISFYERCKSSPAWEDQGSQGGSDWFPSTGSIGINVISKRRRRRRHVFVLVTTCRRRIEQDDISIFIHHERNHTLPQG